MTREEDFRLTVMKAAGEYGMHVSHIEAHQSAAGIPDLNIYSLGRPDLWLELKVVKRGAVKLRPTQKRWHRQRHEAGGRSWVAVLEPESGDILVVPGHAAPGLAPAVAGWRAAAAIRTNCDNFGWLCLLMEVGHG